MKSPKTREAPEVVSINTKKKAYMVDINFLLAHSGLARALTKSKIKIVQTVSGGEDEEVFMVMALYHAGTSKKKNEYGENFSFFLATYFKN